MQSAGAAPYDDALQGFLTDAFTDTADAIEAVAASGDPKAAAVLEALQDGRLVYSAEAKKVLIKDKDERPDRRRDRRGRRIRPADVDTVRLNNRLRGMIGGMIGGLTLMSPDAGAPA